MEAQSQIERLEDRLALLKGLVDGIEDAVALLDATGTILYANGRMAFGPGRAPEDVKGKSINALSLIPPAAIPPALSLLGSVLSGQAVQPFSVEAVDSSGQTASVQIRMMAVKRGDRVIGALVTARSAATAAAPARPPDPAPREAPGGDRFHTLIENGIDWIWEVNEKSVYTYAGAGVRGLLGYEPQEVLGKTILDLVPLADANRVGKALGAAMSERQPLRLLQINHLRKDRQTVTLETTAVPLLDAAGRFVGYQGVHRDVTGRVPQADRRAGGEEPARGDQNFGGIVQALTLIVEGRDPGTAAHQRRVSELGGAMVREMLGARGRVADLDKIVRLAGQLHDVGQALLPGEVLVKNGELSPDGQAALRNHSQAGHNILKTIEFPWPIADIVLQHHERWNGSGYPSGLKGEDIRVEARIIGVADEVDAMMFPRPGRDAITSDNALREINRAKGTLYDPEAAEACLVAFLDRGFKLQ